MEDAGRSAPVRPWNARPSAIAPEIRLELTERELDIMRLVGRRWKSQKIATELNLSLYTVKNHIHRAISKARILLNRPTGRVSRMDAYRCFIGEPPVRPPGKDEWTKIKQQLTCILANTYLTDDRVTRAQEAFRVLIEHHQASIKWCEDLLRWIESPEKCANQEQRCILTIESGPGTLATEGEDS